MKQVLKYAGYILLLFVAVFFVWRFSFILVWIVIAAIISFIGHPIVRFFDGLHIKKWSIPHGISSFMALIVIFSIFLGILAIFVPLIVREAETISHIDVNQLSAGLQGPMQWLDVNLHTFGIIPEDQSLHDFIVTKAKSVVNMGSISMIATDVFNFAGSFLVGLFSVLFIAFFFIRDDRMFEESILLMVPEKNHQATRKVIADSKNLLMRYFIGVLLEVLGVMSIISLGLWILGVENALLIGFFGGMMNIIPYIGPVLGALIAIVLALTTTLEAGAFNDLFVILSKLGGVLMIANLIDNNILVPVIYSKSVKAHPLEIFFVIIMGGSLAGLLGMLLAIPVYTVLRVIAKTFFNHFRVVQKLTDKID